MELAREEAIEQHRDMWNRIYEHCNERGNSEEKFDPFTVKAIALKEMNNGKLPELRYNCYLCDYAYEKRGCLDCPIDWGREICGDRRSAYGKFISANSYKEASVYALRIRDLKERKNNETNKKRSG